MATITFKKFLELSDYTLTFLLSDMFTETGYAINEKNEGEYDQVKKELKETWSKEDQFGPCIEDIFAGMLERGMTILVTDPEGDDHDVTLADFEKGLQALIDHAKDYDAFADYLKGNADACSALNFIDCIIFGEPVYG
jgi:hypothetical protein